MKIRSLLIFSLLTFIIACVPPSKQEITQVDLDLNRNDIRQLIDLINADLSDSLYTYLNHIDPSLRFLATNANASLKTICGEIQSNYKKMSKVRNNTNYS